MPKSTESLTALKPLRIFFYKTAGSAMASRTIEVIRNNRFNPIRNQPSPDLRPTTPRDIHTSIDDLVAVPSKESCNKWIRYLLLVLFVLLLLLALAIFAMMIAALIIITKPTTTTTTATTTSTTSTTTTTSVTTPAKCRSPYVQDSSGSCINILIDINNCGKLKNVCPSNYASCSEGVCSDLASIILLNGTFIWAASVNKSVDDAYYTITLPFNVTLYNTTKKSAVVTTNGVVCLGGCANTFTETALPTSVFSGATILPFWDDLYFFENTSQGIYYQTGGISPNRTFTIEYYCSHYLKSTDYYHFEVVFFENKPGVVQCTYYQATDGGTSATTGVQGSSSAPFIQYSFDQANSVAQNMVLTFDTNTGSYNNSTIG